MGEPREFQHPALVTYYLLLATSFPFAGSAVQWRGLLWRALGAAVLEQFSGRDPPPPPFVLPLPLFVTCSFRFGFYATHTRRAFLAAVTL